jgi:hypothetical protein
MNILPPEYRPQQTVYIQVIVKWDIDIFDASNSTCTPFFSGQKRQSAMTRTPGPLALCYTFKIEGITDGFVLYDASVMNASGKNDISLISY